MKRLLHTVIIFFIFIVPLHSQDTISIEGITVQASRIQKISGYKQTRLDSLILQQYSTNSFSDMLSRHSPVFIKSYGQGALASASFRGTSASHTKVLWNGVEINSPMLGQTDFSMIPVTIADEVTLNHGGGSISKGSGALGGSITINNEIDWSKDYDFEFIQDAGSFDTYKTSTSVQLGNNNLQSRTRLHYSTSENDFSFKNNFKNREDPPTEVRQNAGYNQTSLLQELYWKPTPNDVVTAHLWGQNYSREIAPPLGVNGSIRDEKQNNQFLRSVAEWKKQLSGKTISIRSAWLYDYLNYQNNIANIDSDNYSYRWVSVAKFKTPLTEKLDLKSSLNYKRELAHSENYKGSKQRNTLTAFAGLEYTISPRLITRLMLRQQMVDGELIPLIPSAGLDYQLVKHESLYLKANISRNYRLPTLNDLYWSPGGNRELQPEEGVSWELGLDYTKSLFENLKLKTEVTGYQSNINNWISWLPDSVMSFWTPQNFRSVTSKGLESSIRISWKNDKLNLISEMAYYLTRTYDKGNQFNSGKDAHEQFIYVPQHSYSSFSVIRYKNYQAGITYRYTGKRFTTPENDAYMPSFQLLDLSVSYNVNRQNFQGQLAFKINNVFDTNYQVVAWRPMPGRNYHIVLKLNVFR